MNLIPVFYILIIKGYQINAYEYFLMVGVHHQPF
jgi:hypothetical protein